ncbi:MAG: hypothetical protein ACRDL5_12595 [Solirubrobacteraceae bacterium]
MSRVAQGLDKAWRSVRPASTDEGRVPGWWREPSGYRSAVGLLVSRDQADDAQCTTIAFQLEADAVTVQRPRGLASLAELRQVAFDGDRYVRVALETDDGDYELEWDRLPAIAGSAE